MNKHQPDNSAQAPGENSADPRETARSDDGLKVDTDAAHMAESLTATQASLAAALLEINRHVGSDPLTFPRTYALMHTATFIAQYPAIAEQLLGADFTHTQPDDPHVTPVELEDSSASDPIHAVLAATWPTPRAGSAVIADLPAETWQLRTEHDRDISGTVRVLAGILDGGESWCIVRGQHHQTHLMGPAALPDLVEALRQTHSDAG